MHLVLHNNSKYRVIYILMFLIITNYQVSGIDDLFVFDGGSFYCDSNSSIGNHTLPGEYELGTIHVQDRGTLELYTSDKKLNTRVAVRNFTVSSLF